MANAVKIAVISVPSDIGSMIAGKSSAPEAIKQAGLTRRLADMGYRVRQVEALRDGPKIWSSDATFEPNGARNEEANVEVNHDVKEAVVESVEWSMAANPYPSPPLQIIVGGECNIVPAILSGLWTSLAPKRIGLMYVDADADLTIPNEPGSSGNLASMTFTHLTMRPGALDSMKPFTRLDGSGVVDNTNAVIFGLNSANHGNTRRQLGYLFDEGYRVFTSSAVARDPIGKAKQALEWLEEGVDHILVHLDVDAIDGSLFPLANLPQRTGAGFDEMMQAVQVFLSSEKTLGLMIAEVNPDHDPGLKMTNRLVDALTKGLESRAK